MRTTKSLWGWALVAPAIIACTNVDNPTPPGTVGELGNGQFFYSCDSTSDPLCDVAQDNLVIPEGVAVGARFGASYTPDLTGGKVRVLSASEELLENTDSFGSIFEAKKPGVSALLAQQGDRYIDFVHVRLAPAAAIQVDALEPVEAQIQDVTIPTGSTRTLRAQPLDDKGVVLAGGLACNWEVEDDSIARIATDSTDNQVVLEGVAPGTTTATIKLGTLEQVVAIEVGDGGVGGSGGGGGEGGGGGAGGAGGEGGGA